MRYVLLTKSFRKTLIIVLSVITIALLTVASLSSFAEQVVVDDDVANWELYSDFHGYNYGSSLSVDDTVFHSGKSSIKYLRKSLYSQDQLNCKSAVDVTSNTMYESLIWVKSRNADAGTEFHLNLVGNDANKTVLSGVTQVLNTSNVVSQWTRVYTRVLIPEGITQVTPQITVTNGSVELWFDSLEINPIALSVVDQATHFQKDSDGNYNGFVASNGKYVRTLNQLTDGDAYVLTTNASANGATLTFFDILGNQIAQHNVTVNDYCFVAPSCYYAEVAFSSLPTTYTLKKVYDANMIETSKYWSNNAFTTTFTEAKSGVAFVYEGNDSYLFYDGASSNNVYFSAGKNYELSVWVKVTTTDGNARFTPYFRDANNTVVYFDTISKQQSDGSFTTQTGQSIAGGYDGWIKMSKLYTSTANFSPQFTFRVNNGYARVVVEDFCVSEYDATYKTQVQALLQQNKLWDGSINGQLSVANASQVATAGEDYVFDLSFTPKTNATVDYVRANIYLDDQKISSTNVAVTQTESLIFTANQKVSLQNCKITLPDWLTTNSYKITLGYPFVGEPILQTVQATASDNPLVAKVENSTIYINEQAVSPILYLGIDSYSSFESKPDKSFLKQSNTIESISQSGISLYSTFTGNIASMWKEDGSIDFSQFDQDIYEMLCTTSNAKVMVNIGLYAPDWWLAANPNEQTVVYTSASAYKQNGSVSFASTKFRTDAGVVVQQILSHMQSQPYYNAVFAIKLSAGGTNEWQYQGFGDTSVGDYSSRAVTAFQNYCQKVYSDIGSLNSAWGLKNGFAGIGKTSYDSFEEITLPTYDEIYTNSNALNTNRKVVDYNLFVNDTVVDTFLHFAQIVKTATANQKIVGGYGAYLWVHETAPIGFAGTSAQRLYSSPYIDFLSSPLTYHERYLGMDSTYMGLNDAIRAYGKIYLLEQDSRTALRTDYGNVWTISDDKASGQYFNLQDTLSQLKRDFANNFVNGTGFWMYDMENGWYDDQSIYQLLNSAKSVYDNGLTQDVNYKNQVAVIVDDQVYAYTARKSSNYGNQLYFNLYRLQRQNLALMGTGYDVYAMSTLADGKVPSHKVYLFLAPTEFSDSELQAINNLKQNGNYLVFVSMTGTNVDNMKQATGLTMATTSSHAMQVEITNADISNGKRYGAEKEGYKPVIYVNDSSATKWGNVVDSNYNGLAYKNNSTWHCVYSSAPNLPNVLLKYLLQQAGVHVYSQDSGDIIHSNNQYVSLYSQNGGEKTIALDGYYKVIDAYTGNVVSQRANTINYLHRANDTRLFNLVPTGDIKVDISINGEMQTKWCEQGETIQLDAPAVEGKRFVGWSVNGQIVSQNATFAHIVGETAQTIVAEYIPFYTLTIVDGSSTTSQTYDQGATVTLNANVPTGHDFVGWQEGDKVISTQTNYQHTVTDNATITATYKKQQFDVTWVIDGKTQTDTYDYGATPSFKGSTAKASDNLFHYQFVGWKTTSNDVVQTLPAVTQSTTYTAQYQQSYVDYVINFVDYDDTPIESKTLHWGDVVTPPQNPSRPSTAQYTYEFAGWHVPVAQVSGNATYKATYSQTLNEYLITFANEDGTVLQSEQLPYGATPTFDGTLPTKQGNAQYTFTFDGWTPQIVAVTQNATYTATYRSTANKYTIEFVDENGNVLQSQLLDYGATPTFDGALPTKQATAQYTFTFDGWTPQVVTVTQNATYTATYSQTLNEYLVTFANEDGTVLQSEQLPYGAMPEYLGKTPTKPSDVYFTYQFGGWEPQMAVVTQNATYQAIFVSTPKTVQVTWVVDGSTQTEQVNVGQTVSEKPAEKQGYTFDGWYFGDSLFDFSTQLTHDVTLTAKFTKIEQSSGLITVTWVYDGKTQTELFERGKPINSKTVTKQGYKLDGWLYDGNLFDFSTVVNNDITLTAKFTQLPQTAESKDNTILYVAIGGGVVVVGIVIGAISSKRKKR